MQLTSNSVTSRDSKMKSSHHFLSLVLVIINFTATCSTQSVWEDVPDAIGSGRIHLFRSDPYRDNRVQFDVNPYGPGTPWWISALTARYSQPFPYCRKSTDTNQCFLDTRMNEFNNKQVDIWLYDNNCNEIGKNQSFLLQFCFK